MKMKNILLLLSALIVVPAYAGDAAVAPSTEPSAQTIQTEPAAKACGEKLALLGEEASQKAQSEAAAAPAAAAGCTFPCSLQQCPPGSIATCRQRLCGALC